MCNLKSELNKSFDWKAHFKHIKKNNSLFQMYKNNSSQQSKITKKNTYSHLKLSQMAFSKLEKDSGSSSKIMFPKTTKAENNINIYSEIHHIMGKKKKKYNSKNELRNSGVFGNNRKKNKAKAPGKDLKKSKRMTNFSSNKYSKTFNKIPTSFTFYASENFNY